MSNHVVIINGKPRAGKDTVVSLMAIELKRLGYTVSSISSIDCVKGFLNKAKIDTSRKSNKDRDLLAEVGAALEKYNDFRTTAVVKEISVALDLDNYDQQEVVIFIHMRELFMREKLHKFLIKWKVPVEYHTLFVDRDVPEVVSNTSDANVAEGKYELIIKNNSDLVNLMSECVKTAAKIVNTDNTKSI